MVHAILAVWAAFQMFPLVWMFYSSFKTETEIRANIWMPTLQPTFDNFAEAWQGAIANVTISVYFFNSLFVTAVSLVLLCAVSAMASYALGRYRMKAKMWIVAALIIALSVPIHSIIIPIYIMFKNYGLINSYWGLIFPYVTFGIPFSVLLLTAYFRTFPAEIEEAAYIDGCSEYKVFLKIILPIAMGPIVTVAIINFVALWNEFLFALVLIRDNSKMTLPVGLMLFIGERTARWAPLFAALTISTVPVLLFFFLFQRQILTGMTVGSVKG